jgi:hypothetical protein
MQKRIHIFPYHHHRGANQSELPNPSRLRRLQNVRLENEQRQGGELAGVPVCEVPSPAAEYRSAIDIPAGAAVGNEAVIFECRGAQK